MSALIALLDVTAENRRSTVFDGVKDSETVLVILALAAAFRIIRNTALVVIGFPVPWPGNNQRPGLLRFQYCRNVSSRTGESMTLRSLRPFAC